MEKRLSIEERVLIFHKLTDICVTIYLFKRKAKISISIWVCMYTTIFRIFVVVACAIVCLVWHNMCIVIVVISSKDQII